jgi:adenylate cyclase
VRSNQALWAGLAAALLSSLIVVGFRLGRILPELEALERRTLDARFVARGARPADPRIAIVAYDDKTIAEDPSLFERRAGWARLLHALGGARAVGIDAFFTSAERILPPDLAAEVTTYAAAHAGSTAAADQLLERIAAETRGDEKLTDEIKRAGNIVLGVHMGLSGEQSAADPSLSRSKFGQSVPGPWQPRPIREVIASLPAFNRAARALGIMTVHEDDTHTVRVMPMVRALGDSVVAPLCLQLVAQFDGTGRAGLAWLGTDRSVHVGERVVPLSDDDGIWLNFRGPAGTFTTYSAVDLAAGRTPTSALDGKIVLVGFTHLGRDRTRSAFGPGQPGVEMHATAVDNLLHGDWLRRAPWFVDGAASLALGVFIALLFWPRLRLPAYAQTLLALGTLLAYLGASYLIFAHRNLWLSWIGPFLATTIVGACALTVAYAREGAQRRRLRHAFGHYLAEGVIEELLRDPGALTLGGERRNLSVLFSDIRGFTSFSERLAPEQLVKVLNTYLTPMTGAVLDSGGFLDKFIGDAVMAVFGAPVPDERHPRHALACAVKMHAELERIRPELSALGVDVEIGVGINSGDMAVGNMGSVEHFNYTVMGDAVNLASRLEGLTKTYGVFCLVGEETRRAASDAFAFREVDLVRVKGKAQPVAIFELLSGSTRALASYTSLDIFAAALAHYRAGSFADARREFSAFAAENPRDPVAALYLTRLVSLGDTAPADWDGVTAFTTK